MGKTNIASTHTKNLLAETLKELLNEKSYSKITITELVQRAGINRKTFYYHFRSTDALLAWMIERETVDVVKKMRFPEDTEAALNFIIDYLEKNHQMLRTINSSIGYGSVHKFLYRNIYPIVVGISQQVDLGVTTNNPQVRENACRFYTEGIAGTLQSWIENPSSREAREITQGAVRRTEEALRNGLNATSRLTRQ